MKKYTNKILYIMIAVVIICFILMIFQIMEMIVSSL
ncbi:hypothetical protein HMPREF9456_01224 [Dysgonomonas mossii DSM 22836]|uniref:DUF4044 domain-containing protein n=1 Tax=Dysgonomonas mossii DSM 22836 TaxID=742767 RepID=F8WZ23_9BACT|nr:hypothetical protein HMPREF9456_01224 [Dysgonomonas mossii DSM 22836]